MRKRITRATILLKLWVMRKFGYNLPSLRETQCVKPGELYDHFAYVVRAIPFKHGTVPIYDGDKETLAEARNLGEACLHCDLRRKYIPCNFHHQMADGKDICERHCFEIICKNPYQI